MVNTDYFVTFCESPPKFIYLHKSQNCKWLQSERHSFVFEIPWSWPITNLKWRVIFTVCFSGCCNMMRSIEKFFDVPYKRKCKNITWDLRNFMPVWFIIILVIADMWGPGLCALTAETSSTEELISLWHQLCFLCF